MDQDHQLLAPKDDLKSALKVSVSHITDGGHCSCGLFQEAGIPPGAVLAITQYLDDQTGEPFNAS